MTRATTVVAWLALALSVVDAWLLSSIDHRLSAVWASSSSIDEDLGLLEKRVEELQRKVDDLEAREGR